jgi:hypothetical protein
MENEIKVGSKVLIFNRMREYITTVTRETPTLHGGIPRPISGRGNEVSAKAINSEAVKTIS